MGKRVVVAMSGGVDSSVCAALLKKEGFDVIGIFMKLWAPNLGNSEKRQAISVENKCCNIESLEGARRVAALLEIPFYTIDLVDEFKKYVVDYYIREYSNCRTPNPCVICNKFIKFDFLLKKAKGLGADFLATGHYVRIGSGSSSLLKRTPPSAHSAPLRSPWFPLMRDEDKPLALFTAKDKTKDQSYFLWTLTQKQLKDLLFPIGDYKKEEVREMARKWGLPTAERAESQGLCFIGYWDNREFLRKFIKADPGPILDLKGNVLGKHKGLPFYTIGQRKGIEIEVKTPETPPLYVIKLDAKNNALIVGEEKDLYQKELWVEDVNWISGKPPKEKIIGARIRYGHPIVKSKWKIGNCKLKIIFNEPVRAITLGQSIVFYSNNEVLGGGVISQ